MGIVSGRPVQPITTEPGTVRRRFLDNLKILSEITPPDSSLFNTDYNQLLTARARKLLYL
jgi:hypothetical protein